MSDGEGALDLLRPVASKIALAIGVSTGREEGSPAPVDAISGWSGSTTSIRSDASVMSRIGQVSRSTLVTPLAIEADLFPEAVASPRAGVRAAPDL